MATKQAISGLKIMSGGNVISSASGDRTITVTGNANTGRHARQSKITITVTGSAAMKEVTINQNGAGMLLSDNNGNSYSIANATATRTVTIKGTTNALYLRVVPLLVNSSTGAFSEVGGSTSVSAYFKSDGKFPGTLNSETPGTVTLPASIKMGTETPSGVLTTNGARMQNDLGATGTYTFEYTLSVPKHKAEQDCYYAFRIIAMGTDVDGGAMTNKSIDVIITSGKGAMFLTVKTSSSATAETLEYTLDSNNSVSFFVDSNTSWTIG